MKYLISILSTIALMFVISGNVNAQADDAISKYFDQYLDDDRFTVVYISPKMFEMFSRLDIETDDEDAQIVFEIAKDLKGLRVLTTEVNAKEFYEEAKKKINTSEYEVLMTVREKGSENVDFLIKESGDIINELLLLVGGGDEFVMLSFVGNIDLDKISKLAKSIDVKGAEHLEKIEDREKKND